MYRRKQSKAAAAAFTPLIMNVGPGLLRVPPLSKTHSSTYGPSVPKRSQSGYVNGKQNV